MTKKQFITIMFILFVCGCAIERPAEPVSVQDPNTVTIDDLIEANRLMEKMDRPAEPIPPSEQKYKLLPKRPSRTTVKKKNAPSI